MRTSLFVLVLCLTALPASAQRLPSNDTPERYTLWFAPDLDKETFRGRESIAVSLSAPSTTITLHADEITFGEVTIEDAGGSQAARVTRASVVALRWWRLFRRPSSPTDRR